MSPAKFDPNFDHFLNDFGLANQAVVISNEIINRYAAIVPQQLITYWQGLGSCAFSDGLIWLTNPADYEITLAGWLEGTPFEGRKDLSVFARTAFGELKVWAKGRGNILNINAHDSIIFYFPKNDERRMTDSEENRKLGIWWLSKDREDLDYEDIKGKFLFKRALKKLGQLEHDEMYGFSHSLSLGGKEALDNLDIVKLTVYHDIARKMKEPEIIEIVV
jgi:hypothetical protein